MAENESESASSRAGARETDGPKMGEIVNAKGLNCPLPVLKARRAMQRIAVGDELTVLATDPASRIDIRHYCNVTGNVLVGEDEDDGVITYVIRRVK